MAEVVSLPFHTKESVDYINSWSNTHTNGHIPHLVDDLNGVMALANAVCFKAPWAGEFPKEETRDGVFTREDHSEVVVPMMHKKQAACYTHYKDFAALGLPYGDGKHWTMYILLPDEGKDANGIVEWLSSETWTDCTQRMAAGAQTVDILLPRFRAEGDYELKDILSKMGVQSMFQSRNEFGLVSSHSEGLCVGLLKQKTFMDVSEEGTEAAAVSIALLDNAVAPGEDNGQDNTATFHATRPFIYLIQEDTSKAILFMGIFKG